MLWHDSHTSFWLSPFLCLSLLLVAQPFACCKCYTLSHILARLHLCCVSIDFGGVMIQFSCTLYSNTKILNSAQILGNFSISLEHSYAHIIISCIHLACWIFWLPSFFCYAFVPYHFFCNLWILNIVCFSSNYFSLYLCIAFQLVSNPPIAFHSYIEKYTPFGGTHAILAF